MSYLEDEVPYGLDKEDGEDRHRTRALTEKGKTYKLDQALAAYKSSIFIWKRTINRLQDCLKNPENSEPHWLSEQRDKAENLMADIMANFQDLQMSGVNETEATEQFEQIEHEHYQTTRAVANLVRQRDIKDSSSQRSVHSSRSGRSSRSHASSRADAAARAVEMRVKLKFLDEESKSRLDLERLQTRKDLEIAEETLKALDTVLDQLPIKDDTHNPVVDDNIRPAASIEAPKETVDVKPPSARSNILDESSLVRALTNQSYLARIPPPEPGVFSGDPLQFSSWMTAFETLIEGKGITQAESLFYLKKYLSGSPREAIEGHCLVASDNSFKEAKLLLKKRYGDPYVIASAFRDKLDSWPKIQVRDGISLRKFSDFLQQCLAAKPTLPSLRFLDDERENRKLSSKMPEWITNRWARIVHNHKTKSKYPEFREFVEFIREESEIACDSTVQSQFTKKDVKPEPNQAKARSLKTESSDTTQLPKQDKKLCKLCKTDHKLDDCPVFKAKTLDDRRSYVKQNALCFGCFVFGHLSRDCRRRLTCKVCNKRHPTSLHIFAPTPVDDQVQALSVKAGTTVSRSRCSTTVPVWVSHKENPTKERLVYGLLDSQSDSTFISSITCDWLGVSGPEVKLKLSTMLAEDVVQCRKISGLQVRGYNSTTQISLPSTYTRESIPSNTAHIPTPEVVHDWPHLRQLSNELVPLQEVEIGLLIGYDCPRALLPRDVIPPEGEGPFGLKTDLGWSVVGLISSSPTNEDDVGLSHRTLTYEVPFQPPSEPDRHVMVALSSKTREVFDAIDIRRIMESDFADSDSDKPCISRNDRRFLEILETETIQMDDGHLQMPLPFKEEPELPDNRSCALSRYRKLEDRFRKDPKFKKDYEAFMEKTLRKGYAEKMPSTVSEDQGNVWYLPHHGVYNPQKPGKIRVVFDVSARFRGESLNSHLLQGPDLMNSLVGVLCRFRKEKIAITCDVEQMFHQFRVSPKHRDYLRFLWHDEGELVDYRLTVHPFGAISSPGCANYGLKRIALLFADECDQDAAKFLTEDFYVDDGLKSVSSTEEAVTLIEKTRELCSRGGLKLHKFCSNSPEVLSTIPQEDRAETVTLPDPFSIEKVLGVQWSIETDTLQFKINIPKKPMTRRGLLSIVGSIYDPLGLIGPYVLEGRLILQQLCKENIDWDEPLPSELLPRWNYWIEGLPKLECLQFPRCFKPPDFDDVISTDVHYFSDASMKGYGQCAYLRLVNSDGRVHCCLLMAKSRVAPLNSVTIPRMELMAAVTSVKVASLLRRELMLENVDVTFWSDSMIVLGYLKNDSKRVHTFVANRVQQIQDQTDVAKWKYVPTEMNPADMASRGLDPHQAGTHDTWMHGPSFLWEPAIPDFSKDTSMEVTVEDPEVRLKSLATTTDHADDSPFDLSRLDIFSNWIQAKKAVARILQLKKKFRRAKMDLFERRKSRWGPPTLATTESVGTRPAT